MRNFFTLLRPPPTTTATDRFGSPDFPDFPGNIWLAEGLFELEPTQVHIRKNTITAVYGDKATHLQTIQQAPDGSYRIANAITYHAEIRDLPRIGLELELPRTFDMVEYWGRGPQENYRDRSAGYPVGRYRTTAKDMEECYIMPQESGNRPHVRELILSDGVYSLVVIPEIPMEFSISRFAARNIQTVTHRHELQDAGKLFLRLDLMQRGIGTGSCGPDTLPEYRIGPGTCHFNFRLYVILN